MTSTFQFNELGSADLHIDAKYKGGRKGNAGDDPLPCLLGVSNQGGFRYLGAKEKPRLIVLTTSLTDTEWPDELDPESGIFTYFGDNKKPGLSLHDTPRFGNFLLQNIFNAAHTGNRHAIPPVLVFSSAGTWRDMIFRGVAVPGAQAISNLEDLVAVWKIFNTSRFQNYRAKFTILDIPVVPNKWIQAIQNNENTLDAAPGPWATWIHTGEYTPLRASPALKIRNKHEQIPSRQPEQKILAAVYNHFSEEPYSFEHCAAEITRMALANVTSLDLTRPFRDGGRDAVGKYQIGGGPSSISVDFSIEAKCYSTSNSVGVRELSRLISRLRHRQFGVIVTTSWVHSQAYSEIVEDRHPVIIISGADIVRILKAQGIDSKPKVSAWLASKFKLNDG